MSTPIPLATNELAHSHWRTALFEVKAWVLRLQRFLADCADARQPTRHGLGATMLAAPILAEHEGSLWPREETHDALVAGKIHNLRLARKRLHTLEVPAGEVFSFWRQLGRANTARGFVVGRELREGCVVPAVGGGLCQLSNAIYDCAVRAGLQIVERHRHSRVMPGSLAEHDRDATVFWNYLDLRLRAPFAWRLEIDLNDSTLQVRIRGHAPTSEVAQPIAVRARTATATGDCTSCDQTQCDNHTGPRPIEGHRTWLCFDPWPEFVALREREAGKGDRTLGLRPRDGTPALPLARVHASLRTRWALWRRQPLPKARGDGLDVAARAMARKLGQDDLHLVVEQGLLPWLWKTGELAGRRFDVLMNALPMDIIQQRLDDAAKAHPDCTSLRDFRAPTALIEAEREALARAQRWITPHAQIAALAGDRGLHLAWRASVGAAAHSIRHEQLLPSVLFPASTLARKGAFELRDALQELGVRLLLPPGALESARFWDGIHVQHVGSIAEGIALCNVAVLPAWIEHQPRGLLLAIASGIPVVATPACGLPESLSWRCIEAGDVLGLREALVASLSQASMAWTPSP